MSNRYRVKSKCLQKSETQLQTEYFSFLEKLEISQKDSIQKNTKLWNIHESILKNFFVSLSNLKTVREFLDQQSQDNGEEADISLIFYFWLFGCCKGYIQRLYAYHTFEDKKKGFQSSSIGKVFTRSFSKYFESFEGQSDRREMGSSDSRSRASQSNQSFNMVDFERVFDGTISKETICRSYGIDEKFYDGIVRQYGLKECFYIC